jgi:broad specificity phosphatase PhoE
MTAVYALRHPETTWNLEQRYQGRLESPLSAYGRRQATAAASLFEPGSLDAVVSSPLCRAHLLATEVADHAAASLLVDHRLTELGQTLWEGIDLSEIKIRYPELHDDWYERPDTVRFPEGESLADVQRRSLSALSDIFTRFPNGHVAVVTHSVVIQVLVAASLALELRHIHRLRIANAGVTTFCGSEIPGMVLNLNAFDPLHSTPTASAAAQGCAAWRPWRVAN